MSILRFELGERVRDTMTGFRGFIVARAEYLNGCISYQIEGKELDKEIWIDEQRLIETRPRKLWAPPKKREETACLKPGGGVRSRPPTIHP